MSLKVNSISYTRTNDLGDGNSETILLNAEIAEDDDPRTMIQDLKQLALDSLEIEEKPKVVQSITSVNN